MFKYFVARTVPKESFILTFAKIVMLGTLGLGRREMSEL